MAASPDEICSLAMELLGHTPFTSWATTQDKHHKTSERLWPTVRDRVLARVPFNSCVKRVKLAAPDPTPPLFDWSNRFPLPADWLRTLKVGTERWSPPYKIEGGFILVNSAEVTLRYVFRNTVTSTYEPALTDLLVQAMVARMALPVTQSSSRAELEQDLFAVMLNSAAALDGAEEDGVTFGVNSPLIDSRFC